MSLPRAVFASAIALLFVPCAACRDKAAPVVADAGASAASASVIASAAPPSKPSEPAFPADGGAGWEGSIRLSVRGGNSKEDIPVFFTIKGDRIRYAAPNRYKGLDAITVVDVALRKLVVFPEEEREYVTFDLPPAASADAAAFPLVATGKKTTIQGLDCDLYEQKRGKASSTACIHEGIPFVDFGMASLGLTPPAWMRSLSLTRRFVLRAVEVDDQGRETMRVEPKAISTSPVRDALNTPTGYVEAKGKMPGSPMRPGLPD